LQAYSALKGILCDLPDVIANVRLDDVRVQPVAGDFFESVPSGGDAYLLRWVMHNWTDDPDDVFHSTIGHLALEHNN